MKRSRRTFVSITALSASAVAASALAQYGGRSGNRGDSGSRRSSRSDETNPRGATQLPFDPIAAVEHELPSLRNDLKLTAEQVVLFDGFERQVRYAAEAARSRARHLSAVRTGDDKALSADSVLGTFAEDDTQRADAARLALERMAALYAALTSGQRTEFDRRIIQSLREPLGTS